MRPEVRIRVRDQGLRPKKKKWILQRDLATAGLAVGAQWRKSLPLMRKTGMSHVSPILENFPFHHAQIFIKISICLVFLRKLAILPRKVTEHWCLDVAHETQRLAFVKLTHMYTLALFSQAFLSISLEYAAKYSKSDLLCKETGNFASKRWLAGDG